MAECGCRIMTAGSYNVIIEAEKTEKGDDCDLAERQLPAAQKAAYKT